MLISGKFQKEAHDLLYKLTYLPCGMTASVCLSELKELFEHTQQPRNIN